MQSKIAKFYLDHREALVEILILIVIFAGVFEIKYYNRFYPNVFIGEEAVGGKSYKEVLENFKRQENIIRESGLDLVFFRNGASKIINVPLNSSGLTADTVAEYFYLNDSEETVRAAFKLGRSGNLFKRLWEQLSLIFGNAKFTFANSVQEEAVRSLLERELVNFYEKPVPAQFIFKNDKVQIVPEKIGERKDNDGDKIIRLLNNSLASFKTSSLFFNFKPAAPTITEEKLRPSLATTEQIVKKSKVRFSYGEYEWRVPAATLVNWLTVDKNNRLVFDSDKVADFLKKKVGQVIYDPPVNSRFQIQNGKLVEIVKGRVGSSIDIDQVAAILNKSIEYGSIINGPLTIKMPIIKETPRITKETIDRYGIKELVTSVKTSFKGSTEGRKHNIQTGLNQLNGLLIAPGEEFSAVEAIGLTREEDGFVKEFVIKGDRSVKEAGGGLCQIATTLFRLAINSGLPVTTRTNHLYVVSYYGPGLDATVYGPQKDLRFINDTGHWLLLQARIEGNEVAMEFYGQRDGREVAISEPKISNRKPPPAPKYVVSSELKPGEEKCTEQARFGMNAEVNYRVKYPSGKENSQIFKSVYQPWQKVCLVGSIEQLTVNNGNKKF